MGEFARRYVLDTADSRDCIRRIARFYAEVAGATVREVEYAAPSYGFPTEALLKAITPRTKAVCISNPNNPTGTGVGLDVLERIIAGILANGHVLIEDYPGLAKTLIARLLAQALDLGFRRIQFTPDLLPSDITGSFLYYQREGRFEFRAGPVFTNLLLAD